MSNAVQLAFGSVLAVALVGCEVVGGFEDFERGSAAASAGSGGKPSQPDGGTGPNGAGCVAGVAPGTEPPTMAPVVRSNAACRWMDETEVTLGQYRALLAVPPEDRPLTSAVCAWKDALEGDPLERDAQCLSKIEAGDDDDSLPVRCVDWCDADAYCTWAGKRLCDGSYANFDDEQDSLWFAACSANGEREYPYGSSYAAQTCNGAERQETGCNEGACVPVAVGGLTECRTEQGIADLSGNVAEWSDECNSRLGAMDQCHVRGGSIGDAGGTLRCGSVVSHKRSDASPLIGFRCCDI